MESLMERQWGGRAVKRLFRGHFVLHNGHLQHTAEKEKRAIIY